MAYNNKSDTFAHRLEVAMNENDINQIELADKTKAFGKYISQSLINKYLKGKAFARQTNIYVLSKILNVSETWLMGYDVSKERYPDEYRDNDNIDKYMAKDNSMYPLLGEYDIAFIYKTNIYKSGETILFSLDEKEYIRKIVDNGEYVEFHAMNPYYPIIKKTKKELEDQHFAVIGKVIKVENSSAFK